ncbi:MAG: cyclic nucleotide-binding domain-containing protein [Myxococcota bacterium]
MATEIEAAGRTDVGQAREHNEDFFLSDPELGLYLVCDGMGGHAAGEVASRQAAETVRQAIAGDARFAAEDPAGWEDGLREAIVAANAFVHGGGGTDRRKRGMGTTCTGLLVRGSRAVLAHVGDSRLYLARDGQLHQLSNDHTFVAEALRAGVITAAQAATSPHGNVLTRAVGPQASVLVDTLLFDILPGDTLVLCSDGLHSYVGPDGREILELMASGDFAGLPSRLVDFANARGGEDNITAVAVRMVAAPPHEVQRVSQKIADLATLRRIHLLCELSMRELSQICASLETHVFGPGAIIVEQGDVTDGVFVIVEGEVEVLRDGKKLASLGAGAHFGEMALLNQRPRSATVRARGHCRILQLPREAFHRVVQHDHVVGVKVLWRLAQTLSLRLDEAYETPRQREQAHTTLNFGLYPSPFDLG